MSESDEQPQTFFEAPTLEELAHLLPQYEMHGFIAQGGMGAVYLARQAALDRFVAIKVLPVTMGGEMDFAARFQIEARAMAKLHHGNIVGVFDFGLTKAGHLFLVMEYVDGATLHDLVHTGKVTKEKALSYALQLCDALQYAHDHGIVHRDIKPNNILISNDGHVKVADFGLARPVAAMDQEVMMGTPDYAAPEIMQGITVDHKADIFAMGVVFYEMLTQKVPKAGKQPASVLSGCDQGWDEVITKATRILPKDRYSQVKEIRQALSLLANRRRYPNAAGPQIRRPTQTITRQAPQSAMLGTMIKGSIALAIGLTAFFFWHERQPSLEKMSASSDGSPPLPPPKPPEVITVPEAADTPSIPLGLLRAVDVANVAAGHVSAFQKGHEKAITGLKVLPDQKRALSVSTDGSMKMWAIATGEVLWTFTVSPDVKLGTLDVTPDGNWAATGSSDGLVRLWNLQTGKLKASSSTTGRIVFDLKFSADGKMIVSGCDNSQGSVQLWPWQDDSPAYTLTGWTHGVQGIALVPNAEDPRFVTVGGIAAKGAPPEMEIRFGSFKSTSGLAALQVAGGLASKVTVSPDGHTMLLISRKSIVIEDLVENKEIARVEGFEGRPSNAQFLDHGRLFIVGCEDRSLRILETLTGKEMWRAEAPNKSTNSVTVNQDETFALTGGNEKEDDDTIAPHMWRLPVLASFVSSVPPPPVAKVEMAPVNAPDTELEALRSQFEAEWTQHLTNTGATARAELDSKYVTALRNKLAAAPPSQRDPFLNEISRVANKGPVPAVPNSKAPAGLQQLMQIYIQQIPLLDQKAKEAGKALLQQQSAKANALDAARQAKGDAAGSARVKALWDEWSKIHG